jgi:hypothetical protein
MNQNFQNNRYVCTNAKYGNITMGVTRCRVTIPAAASCLPAANTDQQAHPLRVILKLVAPGIQLTPLLRRAQDDVDGVCSFWSSTGPSANASMKRDVMSHCDATATDNRSPSTLAGLVRVYAREHEATDGSWWNSASAIEIPNRLNIAWGWLYILQLGRLPRSFLPFPRCLV